MTSHADPEVIARTVEVCRQHGPVTAATWAGVSREAVGTWSRAAGLPPRRAGFPTPEEMRAQLPRPDCPCQMCAETGQDPEMNARRAAAVESMILENERSRSRPRRQSTASDDWMEEAACSTHPRPKIWFSHKRFEVEAAKRVCEGCPVKAKCDEYARACRIDHGVWGGLDETERKAS